MATHLKNLFHFRACSHMQIRIAFVVGWISGYFLKAGGPIPEDIRTETQALRVEIQLAREAVEALTVGRQALVWENWVQRWLLKFCGALDLGLLFWILWPRPRPLVVRPAPLLADTGGSSTDSDESSEVIKETVSLKGPVGKGSWVKGRPARPSDFRLGKQ